MQFEDACVCATRKTFDDKVDGKFSGYCRNICLCKKCVFLRLQNFARGFRKKKDFTTAMTNW